MPPESSLGYFITVCVTKLKNKTKTKPPNQKQTKKPPQPKKLKKILLMLFYFYSVHQRVAATVLGSFPLLNNYWDDDSYFWEWKSREEATII